MLTMTHLRIMLYTYWTPLKVWHFKNLQLKYIVEHLKVFVE